MAEKSGLEMLEEILSRLGALEQSISVLDMNVKTLINSTNLATMVNKASGTPLDGWAKAMRPAITPGVPDIEKRMNEIKAKAGFRNFAFETVDASKTKGPPLADKVRGKPNSIMVKGKLKLDKGEETLPLSGASVKIFDAQDKLVKSTKTNRAGHWMSQLVPGKYVALFEGEIDGKKLLPQNKLFEVPETLQPGQLEFEVV